MMFHKKSVEYLELEKQRLLQHLDVCRRLLNQPDFVYKKISYFFTSLQLTSHVLSALAYLIPERRLGKHVCLNRNDCAQK